MVPKGPLIRANGYNITIGCRVSGYQGPSEQTFHWSVYFPSAPEQEIRIVSTEGPSFAFNIYVQRVKSRGIFVERITGDQVLLHITDLQANDAGEYECYTPNTDPSYYGNYSAKTNLLVIPDTLNVAMTPQILKKVEGDRLELICTVAKATSQHTHLSVAWHLSSGSDNKEILSLSRDFVLSSEPSYRQRFTSGDLRMDKTGSTIYQMTIANLQPSDQGEIYCEAIEWIQDPDGSWKDITKKKSETTLVTVERLGRNFTTSIKINKKPLVTGDSLDVTCSIQAQNLAGRLFHMSWLLKGVEVAAMDPHGVSTLLKEYKARASLGQLQVGRRSLEEYNLLLFHVTPVDGGIYNCEVSEVERGSSGPLVVTQSKRSADISVHVPPAENNLEVSIRSNKSLVMEGQSVVFHCTASGTTNPLSVTWYHVREQEHTKQIAQLERDGSLRVGPSYQGRWTHGTLRLEKTGPASFELELDHALMNDSGLYGCQVKEWSQAADGKWGALDEKHQETSFNVTSLGTGLGVTLQSRTHTVQLGGTIVLMCLISAPVESPVSITWQVLPPGATDDSFRPLVRVLHGGGVEWMGQYFQDKGVVTRTTTDSKLTLRRASWKDATSYRCKVEALRRSPENTWVTAATTRSNRLTIVVTLKKSALMLDTANRHIEIGPATDTFEVDCQLTQVQDGSRYNVTWYLLPPSDNVQPSRLFGTDLDGVVQYSPEVESLDVKTKYHTERVSKTMYKLHVLRVDHSDQGAYYCAVEEWAWPADDGWIFLGRRESGKTTVEFQRSDNNLQLVKANSTIVATESEEVTMNCGLEGSARPDSLFSVTWFYKREPSRPRTLLKMGHHILVEYPDKEKRQRIRFDMPSRGNYSLTLQALEEEDGGLYYCQVEEWLLDPTGSWVKEGADLSGFTHLTVHRPADNLRINTTELSLILPEEAHSSLILPCEITSRSSPSSVFSVAWWKVSDTGEELVFRVGQDLVFQFGRTSNHGSDKKMDGKLRFERPSEMSYQLTVMRPEASDSGVYFCQVEEWMRSPAQSLYRISKKRSGNLNVTLQPAEKTVSSSACSSTSLTTYILVFAIILVVILVIVTIILWMKLRRSDHQRFHQKKGKDLWVASGKPVRSISVRSKRDDEDDDEGGEAEEKSVL